MTHRDAKSNTPADVRGREGQGLGVGLLLSLPYWAAVALIMSLW